MKTTLNKIKEQPPCEDGWKKLLKFLNKTEADDEELDLLTILESNGLRDALWALRTVDGFEKEKRLMACDFAESVVHLTNDERYVNAIKVSRAYANGEATEDELENTRAASYYASTAASAAAAAAIASAAAARFATYDAATNASYDTATTAAEIKESQIIIFKKYCK